MSSVAAAAERQVHILAAVEQRRQRHEPEDQHEEDGEAAAHLHLMVHDPGPHASANADSSIIDLLRETIAAKDPF